MELCIKDLLATSQNLVQTIKNKQWERLDSKVIDMNQSIERVKVFFRTKDALCTAIEKNQELVSIAARVNPCLFNGDKILLLNALEDLLSGDNGCPMCNHGVLRDKAKEHLDNCKWDNAKKVYFDFKPLK